MKVKQTAEVCVRIGSLSRQSGVSQRLLRYYEEQGLLRPRRLANGYREYSESDIASVRHIRVMLAAGLPTAVIVRLLDCVHDDGGYPLVAPCPGVIASLQHQRDRISEAITQLQASQHLLDTMLTTARQQADNDPGNPGKRLHEAAGQDVHGVGAAVDRGDRGAAARG